MNSVVDVLKDVPLWNSLCLNHPNLSGANLSRANLRRANLYCANLSRADLYHANLPGANLTGANLTGTNLTGADLSGANLSGANLSRSNLSAANLSGAIGLPSAEEFLAQFPYDADGIIVFRAEKGEHSHPSSWKFTPGSILEEIPNPDRTTDCGCGVSFATERWVRKTYPRATVWKCRIRWPWLADVVVPFSTDGKARTRKLELIEKL